MSNQNEHNSPNQDSADAPEFYDASTTDAAFENEGSLDHGASAEATGENGSSDSQSPESLRAAVEDANRRVLLAQAEMENLRKRMRRDYEDQLKYAPMDLLKDFLPVLDNLQRALAAAGSNQSATGLVEGVQMVVKQFEDVLQKHQCRSIPAEGELFDPNFHEAISQMPSEQVPEGVVAHEAVRGYQFHDRVVRPSQVVVSTGSAS